MQLLRTIYWRALKKIKASHRLGRLYECSIGTEPIILTGTAAVLMPGLRWRCKAAPWNWKNSHNANGSLFCISSSLKVWSHNFMLTKSNQIEINGHWISFQLQKTKWKNINPSRGRVANQIQLRRDASPHSYFLKTHRYNVHRLIAQTAEKKLHIKHHGRSMMSSFPKTSEERLSHHWADDPSLLNYFLPTPCVSHWEAFLALFYTRRVTNDSQNDL